ncbi:tripartite tricarboxylate transporter permease [Candidatus Woesearchaeota archaeon]|nr:tripartite tricarboxylate transporter permease [Candidatus Woesearchaeota archaeon]
MFSEILIAIFLGCLMGVITGLTPGLHINLVALILLSVSPFLLGYTNVIVVASFIIAMSITHTFTDFISATYLGAPADDTALAVLPAHRLLLKGMGHEAVKLTVIGSLLCLILTIILSPLLIFAVPKIFNYLKNYIGWILLGIVVFMVLREESLDKKFWAFVVVALSGILGLIVLNMPNLKDPLLPMLSGLFGVSVLLLSLTQKVALPVQRTTEIIKVKTGDMLKALGSGVFSGSLVSIFPGLGPAQAAVLAGQITGKIGVFSYLILVGGINTVSMILSLITLFTIEKARNGSIIVVQQLLQKIDINVLISFLAVALVAGCIATFLALYISRIFSAIMNKLNYSALSIAIIIFIAAMVLYFSGFTGFLILVAATLIGLIPNIIDVSRSNSMACLLVPIILLNVL